ncbi:LuxR C-terminal-related transcriptional regulator [Xanthobacteraceae bacterium A53D]
MPHDLRFTLPLEDIPIPTVIGADRVMYDCNSAYCALYGYERSELIGESFQMLYEEHSDFVQKGLIWRRQLRRPQTYVDERVMCRSDGTRFWCRVVGRAIAHPNLANCGIFCVEVINRPVTSVGMSLTARQRDICALIARGETNRDIAAKLGLSVRTIESHRARIMRQANVANSAELVAWFCGEAHQGNR